jgi:hypothetical protein
MELLLLSRITLLAEGVEEHFLASLQASDELSSHLGKKFQLSQGSQSRNVGHRQSEGRIEQLPLDPAASRIEKQCHFLVQRILDSALRSEPGDEVRLSCRHRAMRLRCASVSTASHAESRNCRSKSACGTSAQNWSELQYSTYLGATGILPY